MERSHIDRYEIHSLLGLGGMGKVYKGRDPLMDRWVAIKTITVNDAYQRERFKQEVRAAGKLSHPNITLIYNVGEEDSLAYIVMELVEGGTLASRLSSPVPWREAVHLLLPISQALAYAHKHGVIHRDVKPSNILVSTKGQVKLTDFGVARLEADALRLTEPGSTVGTPLYTAPEQIRGEAVDGRADLFSLGIVLFELLTGRHPFSGETLAQVIYRITQPEPADLESLIGLAPAPLVDVVGCALNKDPTGRFQSADEMSTALAACLEESESSPGSYASPLPFIGAPPSRLSVLRPRLEVVSDIHLSAAEETLILAAYAGYERIYLDREFDAGHSGARVLLAAPVRSGRQLAQVVIKLDTAQAIEREWTAYCTYVERNLPPLTAKILEEPRYSEDGNLGLLCYTYAGRLGNVAPVSLRTYYQQHIAEDVVALLNKHLFKTFGERWWQHRSTGSIILRHEYDRLLPVHLVVEPDESTDETPRSLVAERDNVYTRQDFEPGQLFKIEGFTVEEVNTERGELTLEAPMFSDVPVSPLRVRVKGLNPEQITYRVGDAAPSIIGRVAETRHDLLCRLAQSAFPGQDFSQREVIIAGETCPNPLYDYQDLLDYRFLSMASIIHGDLNLENVLVTPPSGPAWLIDFATTREGHNLYDFIRLEAQVITKLLPQSRPKPEAVAALMHALHLSEPSPEQLPADLKKPFAMLTAIRQMARACLYDRTNWDEYYLGLTIALLGAMKFKELDATARASALAAAATVRELIETPAFRFTPSPNGKTQAPRRGLRVATWVVAAVLIVALIGLGMRLLSPSLIVREDVAGPAGSPTAEADAPAAALELASPTPSLTPSPLPPPQVVDGTVIGPLDIRSGPGSDYPVLASVPEGNPVRVTGRSRDGKWWQIAHPGGPGGYGWILAEFVDLKGTAAPPIARASPPPTATPPPTVTASPTPTSVPSDDGGLREHLADEVGTSDGPPPAESSSPNVTLEDFEGYDTASLRQAYSLNDAWSANSLSIEIARLADVPERGQLLSLSYEIGQAEPDNYVGLERKLSVAQNWSRFGGVRLWVRNDDNPKTLIFQWGEATSADGEVWKTQFPLEAGEVRLLHVPLTPEFFHHADWSPAADGRIDLDQVDYYGLYIEQAHPASGRIYLDGLELEPGPSPVTVESTAQTPSPLSCSTGIAPEFQGFWNGYRSEMGCPAGGPVVIPTLAEQLFEGGRMFWRSDTDEVYVVYDHRPEGTELSAGNWQNPRWPWDGSHPNGIGLSPPPGRVEPVRGFGWLWRRRMGGAVGPLGWALDQEHGYDGVGRAQQFENGLAFKGSGDETYALLNDGRFFVQDPGKSRQQPPAASSYQDTGFRPASVFAAAWGALDEGAGPLGYPLGTPIQDRNYAKQLFEHGFMFWWEASQEPQPIWIVAMPNPGADTGDTWAQYEDLWDTGQPEFPMQCPEAGPPLGPGFGFGWTWCYESGVKELLGLPREAEFGSGDTFEKAAVQFFQGGVMLQNPADRQVWVLIYGSGWHRFGY